MMLGTAALQHSGDFEKDVRKGLTLSRFWLS
jgi:hypothetical protein